MTIVVSHANFKIFPVNLNIALQDRQETEISDLDNKIFHILFIQPTVLSQLRQEMSIWILEYSLQMI